MWTDDWQSIQHFQPIPHTTELSCNVSALTASKENLQAAESAPMDTSMRLCFSMGPFDLVNEEPVLFRQIDHPTPSKTGLKPGEFDRERMSKALAGPSITIPQGLSADEIGAFILDAAARMK
jgi:hypothetical protein